MKRLTIKGKAKQEFFALMFLGDWFGNKKISETSPEEVKSALAMVYKDKKIDLA